ncbi:MAG: ribonuclease R, partial [Clostridia bacterium]
KKHKVSLCKDSNEIEGELVSLSKSFGFVRPESGGEDIFIPGRDLNSALVGDKVLVSDIEKDQKGYSGRIVRVLKEASDETTGTIAKSEWGFELIPDNKMRYNPVIKNIANAKIGDKVLAKLLQDGRGDWTMAEVVHIFGTGESARVCSDAIIVQHQIPTEFSNECLLEARAISERGVLKEDYENRLDLREEIIFTIDGADAKDLDDAISVKKLDDSWVLGVHIADVSHYIKKNSSLDDQAMERGTSVYFADRVIPMLPKEISNGVCSLTPNTDKLCFSAIITFSLDGTIKKYDFKKTVINSRVKGVYTEINEIFAETASAELLAKYSEVMPELKKAQELANILKAKSSQRGTMEFQSDESRFKLDENGVCIDILPRESGEAQELIEQFMISANICSAKFSKDKMLPFLYRVHESPEAQRIKELHEFLVALGVDAKELKKDKPSSVDFSAILKRVEGTNNQSVVNEKLLRTMEKAKYMTEAKGHFGLNLEDYSHFTSPIRRYPDTSIHRVMTAFIDGVSSDNITKKYKKFCEKSATQSSACEVRAVKAEREAEDCYMAEFMKKHIGESYKGEVSGITRNGVFVKLENSVEGFVSIELFPKNQFVFDGVVSQICKKTGKILTFGTELNVTVAKAHVATGRIDFTPEVG